MCTKMAVEIVYLLHYLLIFVQISVETPFPVVGNEPCTLTVRLLNYLILYSSMRLAAAKITHPGDSPVKIVV